MIPELLINNSRFLIPNLLNQINFVIFTVNTHKTRWAQNTTFLSYLQYFLLHESHTEDKYVR